MPGIAFPRLAAFIVGPLGLGSPRVRAEVVPCPAVLCVATTAFVRPGRFAFGSLPVPWVDALCFVSLPACAGVGSSAGRVGQQTPGCWLRRSPLLRRLFPRRREALPSSRITPLNTCPALRPRWCPARSPWRGQDCCLPTALHTVGFGSGCPDLSCCPPLYIFRSSMTRPVFSPSPLLRTPPLGDRPSVRLPTWWLAFGRVGLEAFASHPLGNIDDVSRGVTSILTSRIYLGTTSALVGPPHLHHSPALHSLQRCLSPIGIECKTSVIAASE